jgi:hypothetical protein
MSVMDMNSRMAMAEKLSVQQLQQAIQSGSLPAYIGIPLIEQKNKEKSQMAAAQQGQEKPPSVASQILQQAEQGIDQLPSNLPTMQDEAMGMADGGIVAFAEGDLVDPYSSYGDVDPLAQFSGLTQADVARDNQRRLEIQRRRKEEKQREDDIRQREFLIQNAPGSVGAFDQSVETRGNPPASTPAPELEDPRLAAGNVGIPPNKETGQRAQVNPNAPQPTARQAAPNAQAPAAQPAQKSALDQYAEMLMAERGGDAKERQQAKGMALLQAGLGIAGGTSPNALANIAQGALPATQAYQSALSNIKKSDRDRIKQLMELGVSKEKLALEAKKLGISEKRFDQMYELETQKLGVMGGSRADAAKNAEILRRDQLAFNYFKELLSKNPMATEAEQAVMQDRARVLAGRDSAQAPKDEFAGFSLVPRK